MISGEDLIQVTIHQSINHSLMGWLFNDSISFFNIHFQIGWFHITIVRKKM